MLRVVDRVLVALCGILVGLTLSVVAGEPPKDSVLALYIVTYADTAGYHSQTHDDGHRSVQITCPAHGDTILTAEVWPEDLANYRKVQEKVSQVSESAEVQFQDLEAIVKELDSLVNVKKDMP